MNGMESLKMSKPVPLLLFTAVLNAGYNVEIEESLFVLPLVSGLYEKFLPWLLCTLPSFMRLFYYTISGCFQSMAEDPI